jgi:hypothetical protein
MNFFRTLAMVGLVGFSALTAAEPVILEQQNEVKGVTIQLLPLDQTVKVGEPLRLNLLYSFKNGGHFMNPFGLSNNHPFPSGEIRVFNEDGVFQDIFFQSVFSGCFPDNEYPMLNDSHLDYTLSVDQNLSRMKLGTGTYRLQIAVYDRLWLDSWTNKETNRHGSNPYRHDTRNPKSVLFSNVVKFKIERK